MWPGLLVLCFLWIIKVKWGNDNVTPTFNLLVLSGHGNHNTNHWPTQPPTTTTSHSYKQLDSLAIYSFIESKTLGKTKCQKVQRLCLNTELLLPPRAWTHLYGFPCSFLNRALQSSVNSAELRSPSLAKTIGYCTLTVKEETYPSLSNVLKQSSMEQTVSVSKVVIIFTIAIRQPFVLFVLCPAPVTGPLTAAKCLLTQWHYYLDIYYPVSRYLLSSI